MHTNRLKLAVAIAALACGCLASTAEARRQYNHGLKRFMQRDPLGLEWFGSSMLGSPSQTSQCNGCGGSAVGAFASHAVVAMLAYEGETNPYLTYKASPCSQLDPLGLTPFQGCRDNQKGPAGAALNTACLCIATAAWKAVIDPGASAQLRSTLNCMAARCYPADGSDPIHIHCDNCCIATSISGGGHAIACTLGLGNHITICGNTQLDVGTADGSASVVAHEISHCCGTTDWWWLDPSTGLPAIDVEQYVNAKCDLYN